MNDFWRARWQEGKIGFHEGAPNAQLTKWADHLGPVGRIFVPLCGKSEDLAFLASRGHDVIGVELVEEAARAFFDEHQRTPSVEEHGPFVLFREGPIRIFVGDVFDASPELLGRVDGFYDRAALVALPPGLRARYAQVVRSLLAPAAKAIVITFEYDSAAAPPPPPYSVGGAEVESLFDPAQMTLLGEGDATSPKFRETGVSVCERCWALEFDVPV